MNKPDDLLKHSKDSSVPILVFENGKTIQESKDIAEWADPDFPKKEPQLFNGKSKEVEPKPEYEQVLNRYPIGKPIIINEHIPSIKSRILEKLETLSPTQIELKNVSGSHGYCHGVEGHFSLSIKSPSLDSLSSLEKQRKINALLKEEISLIHSLTFI